MVSKEDYRKAAEILWGDAGRWACDEFDRLNAILFSEQIPPLPIVIGLVAFGKCLGLTRGRGNWLGGTELPRITLASNRFAGGTNRISDTLLHEMVHAKLILAKLDPSHNARPWCAELERLSPVVLGRTIQANPISPSKINGRSVRIEKPGHLARMQLARWPHSLREPDREPGIVFDVDSY